MKEYRISYFRLNLVLLGYLLYNVIYFLLDYSGGYAFFIVWPVFFLSLPIIVLGDIFIFRDVVKLRDTYKKNKMIQVTSMNLLVIACIGFCLQLTNLANGYWWTINYVESAFSRYKHPLFGSFHYRRYSKKSSRAAKKDIIYFQFSFWGLRCRTV